MADLIWWLGDATTTSAKVVVFADTAGSVSVSGAFGVFTETLALPFVGASYYSALVTVTGLQAGQRYSYTVSHSDGTTGDPTDCSLLAMPENAPFSIAWFSCMSVEKEDFWPLEAMKAGNYVALCAIDDFPYDTGGAKWSPTAIWAASPSDDADNHLRLFLQIRNKPLMRRAMRRWPTYYMPGDHDALRGDDWDHSIAAANRGLASNLYTLQSEVDAHWLLHNMGALPVMAGNPSNDDGVSPEVPSESDGEVSDYPVRYFRKTIGNVELFFNDEISYRSPVAATDNSSKHMLGANQEAWTIAQMQASTAMWKVWMGAKKLCGTAVADNADTWRTYTTRRDALLAGLDGVTGLIRCAGDKHHASVQYLTSDEGFPIDLLEVNPCGLSQDMNGLGDGYLDSQSRLSYRWKRGGDDGLILARNKGMCFGALHATSDTLTVEIIGVQRTFWRGQVLAGSNALTYPRTRFA